MASQTIRDASFIPSTNRSNFKEILAKRPDWARYNGGRMAPASAGQLKDYPSGLVIGRRTSDGLLVPYATGNSDGSQVPVGILYKAVTTDEFGNGSECVILKQGVVYSALLIGLDAGAITALKGSSDVEHGNNLFTFSV